MKALLLILLFPFKIFSQNLTGIWDGILTTSQRQIPYELVISETDDTLRGYSYISFTVNNVEFDAMKSVTVKEDNDKIIVEEKELLYNNFTDPQPKRIRQIDVFTLENNGTTMRLEGTFSIKKELDLKPITGEIVLRKRNTLTKTPLINKLDEMDLSGDLSFYHVKQKRSKVPLSIDSSPVWQNGKAQIAKNDFPQIRIKELPRVIQPKKEPIIVAAKPVVPAKPKETAVATTRENDEPAKRIESSNTAVVRQEEKPVQAEDPLPKAKNVPEIIPAGSGADIAHRKIENIQTLYFHSDSLVLILYDNGIVDGDTVSVFLNGKVIMGKIGLSTEAYKKTIYTTSDLGDSLQFIMYAENLGSIPPNTGLLIIMDGKERHEIFFSGDLEKNSAITLRRAPKG